MSTFIICGIVCVLSVILTALYFKEVMSRMQDQFTNLNDAFNSQKFKINEMEVDLILLRTAQREKDKTISKQAMEISSLTAINTELKKSNSKLLKQASDDVTVNVKAGDDATIVLPTRKKRGRPKKKSNNGRSNTNNGTISKGKQ